MPRVLIIESQPSIRLALRRFVASEGYEPEALDKLPPAQDDPWDVVLLDTLQLPTDLALDQAVPATPPSRIVAMGPSGSPEVARSLLDQGAFACLEKPVDFDHLSGVLQRCLSADPHPRVAIAAISGGAKGEIVARSHAMRNVLRNIELVASHDVTVLITGESGTGKELVARGIHAGGPRSRRPFEAIHCGAIPPDLLESELFGHEKGSFTDAHRTKIGRFEAAADGTIFLDEIGEMPPGLQVKLLRALQEREIQRIGGTKTIVVKARIVAATHRDLDSRVMEGAFRQDLLHRLKVAVIDVPPLRDRPEDIELLAGVFAARFAAELGKPLEGIDADGRRSLLRHRWPGNVRELENTLHSAVVFAQSPVLTSESFGNLLTTTNSSADWKSELGAYLRGVLSSGHSVEEVRAETKKILRGLSTD